jgi:uncharacterized protein (TIGR03435 family)
VTRSACLCLICLIALVARGQSFEVASIKSAPPRTPGVPMSVGCNGGPGSKDPGRWTCQNMSIGNLVSMAWALKRYQMADQGGGFDTDRFNITATLPPDTTREQFRLMQQALLKERFKLELHFEKREVAGYELVVAKNGAKLKDAAPHKEDPDAGGPPSPAPPRLDKDGFPIMPSGGRGMIMMNGKARWQAPETTAEQIANMIGGQLNRPVADATGLAGKYDVALMWVNESMGRGPEAEANGLDSGPTLTTAIQEQLGLKLQSKKTAIDFLVIDRVEKLPTEN